MTVRHDKPIGVDAFFREIFAGDTVRDLDGKEYIVDARGDCKPLQGAGLTSLKKLGEVTVVEHRPRFQEQDGKVVPAMDPKPEPRVRLAPIAQEAGLSSYQAGKKLEAAGIETFGRGGLVYVREKDVPAVREALKPGPAPEAKPEPEPAPAARFIEGPAPHRGGRVNTSGFSQLGNLARRFGMTTNEVRKICGDAGIEVVSHGPAHKAHVRVEDLPAVRKLLEEASGIETTGNNGNHRPNTTGYVTFANLARSLKCKAHVLRAFAGENGIPIVRPANKAHRNDGIYKEDEERFRDLWTENNGPAAPAPASAPVIPPDDLKRPVLATSDPAKVWSKFDAFLILEDQDLADELRRRGYEVIAIKHVEL